MRQVVVYGAFGEGRLRSRLADAYTDRGAVLAALNDASVPFAGQLRNFFQAVEGGGEPVVIVLDDFEQNMEGREQGDLQLTPEAFRVLRELGEALRIDGNWSRLVVTCRYFDASVLPVVDWQVEALERMPAADARKLVKGAERSEEVLAAGDGNPRLISWLRALPEDVDFGPVAEERREEFREDVLARQLLASLPIVEREAVARICWFGQAVEAEVVEGMGAAEEQLGRAVELGLVERDREGMYRVPEVLRGLLEEEFVGSAALWREQAARVGFAVWWETESRALRAEELARLAMDARVAEVGAPVVRWVASGLIGGSRFQEGLDLCLRAVEVFGWDYRLALAAGRAGAVLGTAEAQGWLERAWKECPETDRVTRSSAAYNLAGIRAQQGEVGEALRL